MPNSQQKSGKSSGSKDSPTQSPKYPDTPPSYDNSVASSTSSINLLNLNSPIPPPIQRQSSSSLLRSGNHSIFALSQSLKSQRGPSSPGQKKKNVPYQPAPEQQEFIDKLGNPSVTSLSTTTSGAHTEYFDVLPSFQMFQSILKRDDDQFNENLIVSPPEYGDTINSSPTPPSLSPVGSATLNDSSIDGRLRGEEEPQQEVQQEYNEEENYAFGEDESNDGLQPTISPHNLQNVSHLNNTYGHTVLDNIDKLPKLNASPIDIQIFVTKEVPEPNQANELETRLKEYSNGDLVNGYIIITNTSSKPINFGLFTVSLEGTIKAAERKLNPDDFDKNKFSKVLMKKVLKMYDLNASYNVSYVPNSAGIEYEAFSIDEYDKCQIGLPMERILYPNTKYKKFFTFKFPGKLLDTTCSSNVLPHILPPPSFGVDRTAFNGQTDNIELNKALGYGFISTKGTPLMTKDYAFDDMSISYTIEAKFIDKLNNKATALSHNEINESSNEKDYIVSAHKQYFVRFVPDLKELIAYFNEEIMFGKETYGSIGIDGKLFRNYLYLTTWRYINSLNSLVEHEIDARLTKEELNADDIKHKNLIVDNFHNTNNQSESLMLKQQGVEDTIVNPVIYDDLYFRDHRMIGSKTAADIFGKKKKKLLSSIIKIGTSKIYVRVPSQPLAYNSPKLIMKYNVSDKIETNELLPVNSISSDRVSQVYNRVDEDISKSVNISLVFEALDNGTKPPEIANIDINIVAWSFRADYPIPFEFEYDFFYESLHANDTTNLKDHDITKTNLQMIKNQTDNYIQFLKANKTFISKNSFLYLKSISTLGIKKDTIVDYFKPIIPTSNAEAFKDDWKGIQTSNNTTKWVKSMELPLQVMNKHNIALIPSFQSCLQGRLYCLQVSVKYKGGSDKEENIVKVDVPLIVG